jgi:hypothetical protein
MVTVNGKNTLMLYGVMKHAYYARNSMLLVLVLPHMCCKSLSECSMHSHLGANFNFEIQPLRGTCGVIIWNGWFLTMTLALAGPGSLLLTLLSILYLLQCFLLIGGKKLSIKLQLNLN